MQINQQYSDNIMYIFIVVSIIVAILLFMHLYNIDLTTLSPKKLLQVVTIEGMKDKNDDGKDGKCKCDCHKKHHHHKGKGGKHGKHHHHKGKKGKGGDGDVGDEPVVLTPTDFLGTDLVKSFCSTFQTSSSGLEQQCNKLTSSNCNASTCCVLLNGQKCVAGSASGPTFQTDSQQNPINIDYYYYQNKCYGNNCPAQKKMV